MLMITATASARSKNPYWNGSMMYEITSMDAYPICPFRSCKSFQRIPRAGRTAPPARRA